MTEFNLRVVGSGLPNGRYDNTGTCISGRNNKDNFFCDIDTSAVDTAKRITPPKKENHILNHRIARFDRIYNQYQTAAKTEFEGHFPLVEIGVNSFAKINYTGYAVPGFMDLNQNKSLEVNIRLFRFNAGLQKFNNTLGFLSGLELNLNDYRFSKPYTIENEEGHTNPVPLSEDGLSKTKLSTIFLTAPFLLEFQFPAKKPDNRFFVSGGVIGGLRLSSHTKIEQFGNKTKDHNDFNINPFRYGATFRIGYKDINLFATYYKMALFKGGRGPEMFPFTIGIGLINK